MKCDVCDTKIPLGSHECPNCGYKLKDNYVSTFDVSSKIHDHIQTKPQSNRLKIKNIKESQYPNWFYFMIVVLVIGMFVSVFSSSIIKNGTTNSNLSFSELIEEGYDKTIIEMAQSDEQRTVSYLEETVGMQDLKTEEFSYVGDNDSLSLRFEVTGYKNNVYYGLMYEYANQEVVQKEMFTIRHTKTSIKFSKEIELDKQTFQLLGDFIGVKDVYSIMDQARHEMVADVNDENYYSYSGEQNNIYTTLTEESDYTNKEYPYHYYCAVSK